jgi:DNA-binding FadR family transcriptional regulator
MRIGLESPAQRRAYMRHVQTEHRRIYAAVKKGDSEAARRHTRSHLEASRERYRRLVALKS